MTNIDLARRVAIFQGHSDLAPGMTQAAPKMLAALKLAQRFLDLREIDSAIAMAEGRDA